MRSGHALAVWGIDTRILPLEQRDQLARAASPFDEACHLLRRYAALDEVVILATCNRFEVYFITPSFGDPGSEIFEWVAQRCGIASSELLPVLYEHRGKDAIRHLFRVSAGLDSVLLGETDVTAQVKRAYLRAHALGHAGPLMNRLFQKALHSTKIVRSGTRIAEGTVSVGALVVKFVEHIFGDRLHASKVLLWGAGKAAETTARHLAHFGVEEFWIANRTALKAKDLSESCRSGWVSWEHAMKHLPDVDIAIVCTNAPHYVMDRDDLREALKDRDQGRTLCIIDLAIPRNVDPAVKEIEGVCLYNIEHIWKESARTLRERGGELARCEELIEGQVNHFVSWIASQTTREVADEVSV